MSEPVGDVVAILGKSPTALGAELKRHGLGLRASEAQKLCGLLGRDPSRAEAFLFDVAWSEHCSYKSSRSTLGTFFGERKTPPHVVVGPGEDAGVIRLTEWQGVSWCLALSHESHNHPSQILPMEGAATGIGGIVRDVYCMGAEVIGVLDALRLGDPKVPACAEIARGVVEGIWRYGNALGVPNLGGDVYFDERFDDNCLVNVVALGILPEKRIIRSRVPRSRIGEAYVAVLVGKPTDSTGFGGASFASQDLADDEAERNLGAVQVADPFLKRVLAEANRVVMEEMASDGVAVGFKDLGAGGIGGATIELAAAANMGVEIYLDNVRTSEPNLSSEATLVSETQERFVWAVPERVSQRVLDVYQTDFELPRLHPGAGAVLLGRFTDDGMVTVRHKRKTVVSCRAKDLTEGLSYERRAAPPAVGERSPATARRSTLGEITEHFHAMLGHPEGASRAYVYRHYDPEVRGATVLRPGDGDACVVAPIPGCPVGVAVAVEGNPHRGLDDPYQAGAWAVAGAVRNVVTVGAVPLALSDCLNFGNPEDPIVFAQFREAVRGIAETADALGVVGREAETLPIITGNVSFYNQSVGGTAIPPSPIVGCVGRIDDVRLALGQAACEAGSAIVWAGRIDPHLGGSLYARVTGESDVFPLVDVAIERGLARALHEIATQRLALAAHDVSEGGALMALFEMLSPGGEHLALGATLDLSKIPTKGEEQPLYVLAFSEGPQVLVVTSGDRVEQVVGRFRAHGVESARVGSVTPAPTLEVSGHDGAIEVIDLARANAVWREGLERWLK